jgi:hypothetical protein
VPLTFIFFCSACETLCFDAFACAVAMEISPQVVALFKLEEKKAHDSKYISFYEQLESSLAEFEKAREWADLVSSLSRVSE